MTLRFYLRAVARESRGSRGRLFFFVACLSVGVAAVVAVSGLSSSFEEGIRRESRQLLAADLVVHSRRPLPAEFAEKVAELTDAKTTEVRELATMVALPALPDSGERPARSLLAELKAVGEGYPFYGRLESDPQRPLTDLLGDDGAVVAPELLRRLGAEVGSRIKIGAALFTVTGTVAREPDRLGISFVLGPRVFVSLGGLARADLERVGSRIEYRGLVRLPDGTRSDGVAAMAARLREGLPDAEYLRIETHDDAQRSLREGVSQVERFLALVALVSLLIGGVGVAQVVDAWLAGRLDAIAVLRCLGMRGHELILLYLGQTLVLGLAGSIVGIAFGLAILAGLPRLLDAGLPVTLGGVWQPVAVARGLFLGTGVALLFGLRPLVALRHVSPLRVLRRDAEPLPGHARWRALTLALLVIGVGAAATLQAGAIGLGLQFTAGLSLAVGALAAAAWSVSRGVALLPRDRMGVGLRHGLRSLTRPGARTLASIVALGVGVLVVLGIFVVQRGLTRELSRAIPEDAPSVFLVDIQPPQWSGVRDALDEVGADQLDSVPVVVGRLRSVDGRSVEAMLEDDADGRRRWVLTREQRLTYLDGLPAGNRLVESDHGRGLREMIPGLVPDDRGTSSSKLWSDDERNEISVERDFARDLGAGVGTELVFDIQGIPITTVVTSLREVDWESFRINFFLIVEPGVLDRAPQFRVAAARLEPDAEAPLQDAMAGKFPNVTVLRIREILEKVAAVLGRISLGVRLLGGFTVLAGIAILGGAISAGSVRRGREVALFKTLGMTRAGVLVVYAVEFSLIGLVAGLVGSVAGGVLGWAVLTFGMDVDFRLEPSVYVYAIVATVALTVVAGMAADLPALSRRPLDVLRDE